MKIGKKQRAYTRLYKASFQVLDSVCSVLPIPKHWTWHKVYNVTQFDRTWGRGTASWEAFSCLMSWGQYPNADLIDSKVLMVSTVVYVCIARSKSQTKMIGLCDVLGFCNVLPSIESSMIWMLISISHRCWKRVAGVSMGKLLQHPNLRHMADPATWVRAWPRIWSNQTPFVELRFFMGFIQKKIHMIH